MDKYFKAAKNKYRFKTPQGSLTFEDLFDLPLTSSSNSRANLDDVARNLFREIRDSEEESFVGSKKRTTKDMEIKLEIVKDVIAYKIDERNRRLKASENAKKKQLILGIIEEKETEGLKQSSKDDLLRMLEEL